MSTSIYTDPHRYVDYYKAQAGSGLPAFVGSQSGNGLGGLFRGLLRMAVPLFKRGFNIAKPHLKNAARNIVGDVVSHVINSRTTSSAQEGSGLMVMARGKRKRPPGGRGVRYNKKRRTCKMRRTVVKSRRKVNKSRTVKRKRKTRNIF